MNDKNILRAIEAILFIVGDPVSFQKLGASAGCSAKEAKDACQALFEMYRERNSGISLLLHTDTAQLVTSSDLAPIVQSFVKGETSESLTPAVLETLSLISYLGPISRPEIDYVRGVNSTFTIRTLLMRGLIERITDKKILSKMQDKVRRGQNLYCASTPLLQYLGLQRIEDLPSYSEYRTMLEQYRSEVKT